MRKLLFSCVLLMSAGFIAACGASAEHDQSLLGNWSYTGIPNWQYEFNNDGTGIRGQHPDYQSFNWSTNNNNHLILNFGTGYISDNWDYAHDGNSLVLTRRDNQRDSYTYIRVEHNPGITGSWSWELDNTYRLMLYPDGTGSRGFLPDTESFKWFSADNRIIINPGTDFEEHWGYSSDSRILSITNIQSSELTYNYIPTS